MKTPLIILLSIFLIGCTGQAVYVPDYSHPKVEQQEPIEIIPPPGPIPMNIPEHFSGLWVRIDTRNYYVNGNTTPDWIKEIQLKGPRIPGQEYNSAGAATWNIEQRYKTIQDNNGCKINLDEIQAYVLILIDIPKWNHYDYAPQIEKNAWNKYLTQLYEHEKGHADITIKYAKEYIIYLRSLDYFESCDKLNLHIDEYFQKLFRRLEKEQLEYDKNTQNKY